MSVRWHDEIVYLVVIALLLLATGAVYAALKKRQPNESKATVYAKAERWVEGVFVTVLIVGLVLLTLRYS